MRAHPVNKLLQQTCYKSAAGLLQVVAFLRVYTTLQEITLERFFSCFSEDGFCNTIETLHILAWIAFKSPRKYVKHLIWIELHFNSRWQLSLWFSLHWYKLLFKTRWVRFSSLRESCQVPNSEKNSKSVHWYISTHNSTYSTDHGKVNNPVSRPAGTGIPSHGTGIPSRGTRNLSLGTESRPTGSKSLTISHK